jgi:hypothetical protein
MTHLERRTAALGPLHRRTLYVVSALLWLTGTFWLYFFYLGKRRGSLGPFGNESATMCLKIHGAAAMAFLIVLGTLLLDHVGLGWPHKRQRPTGVSLLSLCGVLIVTGWGLYYIGEEWLHDVTSVIHSILGFALPLFIFFHARLAKRRLNPALKKGDPEPTTP